MNWGVSKVTQQVKVLATRSDNLSLIPGRHKGVGGEGGKGMISTCIPSHTYIHIYTHSDERMT